MMLRPAWFALVLVTALHAQAPSTADAPLVLPKFTTTAELGSVRYEISKEGKVTSIAVERLTKGTKAYQAGLREGCKLESVNGHALLGLSREEAEKILNISAEPGKPKVYVFTKRGLLWGKRIEITFHVGPRPAQETDATAPPVGP